MHVKEGATTRQSIVHWKILCLRREGKRGDCRRSDVGILQRDGLKNVGTFAKCTTDFSKNEVGSRDESAPEVVKVGSMIAKREVESALSRERVMPNPSHKSGK